MQSSFGICHLSVVPVRAEASDKSEILSELLFGDLLQVIKADEKWVYIRSLYDDYPGWIDRKQYAFLRPEEADDWKNQYVTGKGVTKLEREDGESPLFLLPGSSVPVKSGELFTVNGVRYRSPENLLIPDRRGFHNTLEEISRSFLNAPYLWGGRSAFGIDCSGFSQVVYKMLGVRIPRDAAQQAQHGELVHFLAGSRSGDLAFFDNAEGRITHVGILLDNAHIIHSSGRVKIDPIDSEGIYSEESGKHTHRLRIIRRYV
jgi:hypothetical protein